MKKRSIAARLGVAAMALTLVTASLSSGTLAKYIDTFSGTAQFMVARWNPYAELNGTALTSGTVEVDLAKTAKAEGNKAIQSGTVQNDGTNPTRIAPGMEGDFSIKFSSAGAGSNVPSGVGIDYFLFVKPVAADGENIVTPPKNLIMWDANTYTDPTGHAMQITSDWATDNGKTWNETYGLLLKSGYIPANTTGSSSNTVSSKIGWRWPYETTNGDSQDTTDGAANSTDGKKSQYTVTVVAVQHNPGVEVVDEPTWTLG